MSTDRSRLVTQLGRLLAAAVLALGIFLVFRQTAAAAPRDLPRWIEARLAEGAWDEAAAGYERLAGALGAGDRPALAGETWARAAQAWGRAGATEPRLAARLEAAWAYLAADRPEAARSQLRHLPAEPAPALRARRDLLLARADLLAGQPRRAAERARGILEDRASGRPPLSPRRSDRAFAALLLGEALLAAGADPSAAAEPLRRAARGFRELGDGERAAAARRLRAHALLLAGEPVRAELALERTLARAPGDAGPATLRTRSVLAHAYLRQGRLDAAEALLRTGLDGARDRKDALLMADAFWKLGLIHRLRGERDRAAGLLRRALEVYGDQGATGRVPTQLNNLGAVEMERGEWARARTLLEAALLRAHGIEGERVARTAAGNLRRLEESRLRAEREGAAGRDVFFWMGQGIDVALEGVGLAFTALMAVPDAAWSRAGRLGPDCGRTADPALCPDPAG